MHESLINSAVDTIADAAKATADTLTGSSASSASSTTTSSQSGSSSSASSPAATTASPATRTATPASDSSGTSDTPTPTATTASPARRTVAPASNSSGTSDASSALGSLSVGEVSLPSSTDASSAVESMSRVNDQSDWSSGSGSSNSAASSESSDRSRNEGQGLNSGAIVAITLSCVVLLLGLLCLWFGRHKRWFRKSMSSTPLSAYMTAGNLPSGAQTPVIGLLSPFHTNNLESSASSSCSSMPIAMWEDEAITTMRIPFEKLTTTKLISYGGHGQVYLGTYRGEHVAIKRLLPEKRKKLHEVNDFLAEIKMMAKVDHPRIVRFIGVAWDSLTDLCAVSEFMDGGDLHSVLKHFEDVKRPHGFDFDKARIALQVAHALSYLHSLDPIVLHRDLKSMNILLTSELEAKITDFGVSRQWSVDTMTAGVGTALWMAPEVMMGEHYDASADIFSLGIVLSELDSHLPPYRETWSLNGQKISDTAILDMVASGQLRVEFSANAPRELVELGHACVDLDPTARPSASEVLYRLQVILRMYEAYTI